METQKSPNSQHNREKEKWSWRGPVTPGYITKLQSLQQHGTGTKTEI